MRETEALRRSKTPSRFATGLLSLGRRLRRFVSPDTGQQGGRDVIVWRVFDAHALAGMPVRALVWNADHETLKGAVSRIGSRYLLALRPLNHASPAPRGQGCKRFR